MYYYKFVAMHFSRICHSHIVLLDVTLLYMNRSSTISWINWI